MQMRKLNFIRLFSCFRNLILLLFLILLILLIFLILLILLLIVRLYLNPRRLHHIRISLTEFFEELLSFRNISIIKHSATHTFQKDSCCGLHVSASVMSRAKVFAKQKFVKINKFRQFKTSVTTARELTELSGFFSTCIDYFPFRQRVLATVAQKLTSDNAEVEVNVMTDKVFSLLGSLEEHVQDIRKRFAVFESVFRRDAMHHLGVDRNSEAVRTHYMILSLNEIAEFVVQLPCNLNHSRPVVEVGQRSVF